LEQLDYGVNVVLTQTLSGGTEEDYRIYRQKSGCHVLNQTSRDPKSKTITSMANPFDNL
jgi:hypothetical protein